MSRRWDDKAVERLLVVLPSWVGDAVMATPLLAALRHVPRVRGAEIVGYMRPGLDEVLTGGASIDRFVVGRPSGWAGPWREGRRLAREVDADAAVLLPNSWRLALTVAAAGVAERVGYAHDGRGVLLTRRVPAKPGTTRRTPVSAVDYYLWIATALGAPPEATADRRVRLGMTAQQRQAAETILSRAGIVAWERFALLNPGANREDKRWPAKRFGALAIELQRRFGARSLVNGSPAEREVVARVCATAAGAKPVNLVEAGITLGSLKGLCARAALVVTNDTGTRHVAAGMGCHDEAARGAATLLPQPSSSPSPAIVSLFGPTDPRWARLDYSSEVEVIARDGRMGSITIDEVVAACERLMAPRALPAATSP